MQKLISDDIALALDGRIAAKTTIPSFLTPKRVLEIWVEILKRTIKESDNYIKELTQQGKEIVLSDPETARKMQLLERNVKYSLILIARKTNLISEPMYIRMLDLQDSRIILREL